MDLPGSPEKTRRTPLLRLCLTILLLTCFSGCARPPEAVPPTPAALKRPGYTTHKIRHGETVWAISRRYNVPPQTIIQLNGIKDVTDINVGTELLIPRSDYSPVASTASASYTTTGLASSKGFTWPVKGKIIQRYGDIVNGQKWTGIDIETQSGQDVLAAKGGMVEVVTENPDGWGKVVVIRHNDGIHTWYAHNSKVFVRKGNWVERGQRIAQAGQTGGVTTPELHFKVFHNDRPVDPLSYLPR